jgi:mono/diheme cytochrome c family protein
MRVEEKNMRVRKPIALGALIAGVLVAFAACAPEPAPPPVPVLGAELGDPARGLAYAQENCARCHGVAANQASPMFDAPTFEEAANTPGMTSIAITAWLNTPHESMPNFIVDPEHIDDLSAYIMSLERDD